VESKTDQQKIVKEEKEPEIECCSKTGATFYSDGCNDYGCDTKAWTEVVCTQEGKPHCEIVEEEKEPEIHLECCSKTGATFYFDGCNDYACDTKAWTKRACVKEDEKNKEEEKDGEKELTKRRLKQQDEKKKEEVHSEKDEKKKEEEKDGKKKEEKTGKPHCEWKEVKDAQCADLTSGKACAKMKKTCFWKPDGGCVNFADAQCADLTSKKAACKGMKEKCFLKPDGGCVNVADLQCADLTSKKACKGMKEKCFSKGKQCMERPAACSGYTDKKSCKNDENCMIEKGPKKAWSCIDIPDVKTQDSK
jgi:hypothetical protein